MRTVTIEHDAADKHFSIVTIYGSRGKVLSSHFILTADAKQWRRYLTAQKITQKQTTV